MNNKCQSGLKSKMKNYARVSLRRQSNCFLISVTTLVLAYSLYIDAVLGLPLDNSDNNWPTFPRRNVAALARDGYLRGSTLGFKRSISTLAKNGQLPTFRSPYDETDKQEQDDDGSHDKRNLASIARLRSFAAIKRNVQALARDGYRFGRGQYNPPNDKRNIAALARNGLIHKKDEVMGDEYYYPFYQNSVPPLSEMDGPLDFNEIYDYQQSVNPDILPPLSQVYKRSDGAYPLAYEHHNIDFNGLNGNWYLKRGSVGLPAHGLYRPIYINTSGNRNRRSIYSIPDEIESNDITPEDYENENQDKRSVGSIPLSRISGLGNISLIPKLAHPIQTTPTYRRRQYLLTRTRPAGTSTDH
ncbi:unnamed protein product, partial [Brenthis ino]